MPQSFNDALFPEFFARGVQRFRYSVGVERQSVTRRKMALSNLAVPSLEKPQHGGGGIQALDLIVVAQENTWRVATIRIPQASSSVVILGEKECGVSGARDVFAEKPVHREQESLRLLQGERRVGAAPVRCALIPQVRLQIRHQQSSRGSLPRDIADNECKPLAAEIQEVIIITTYLTCLHADTGIFEARNGWLDLREKSHLHLSGAFEFLRFAPFRLQSQGMSASLFFDFFSQVIGAQKCKEVTVRIFKVRGHLAPAISSGRAEKVDPTIAPFFKFRDDILSQKNNRSRMANELVIVGLRLWGDERKHGRAIRRSNSQPALTGGKASVDSQVESKLVHVELETSLLIANENGHGTEAQIRLLPVGMKAAPVRPISRTSVTHGPNYSSEDDGVRFCSMRSDRQLYPALLKVGLVGPQIRRELTQHSHRCRLATAVSETIDIRHAMHGHI